jgi:hypothetical protein
VAGLKIPENFLYYLSMHRECNERLLAGAGELAAEDVEISLQQEALRIRKMVHAVLSEVHRMKAFVRLSPQGAFVLYGFLKPAHRIGEHICDHFARRNAGIIVVLGNGSESWISIFQEGRIWQDRGQGLSETLDRLKLALPKEAAEANGLDPDVKGLWQVYYDSQYCPERRNLAAFKRHMPRKDQDAAGLRLVQDRRNTTLDDFLGKS